MGYQIDWNSRYGVYFTCSGYRIIMRPISYVYKDGEWILKVEDGE